MIRELLLCFACAGTLRVSRGNDELSKVPACEDTDPEDIYLDLSNINLKIIHKRMISSAKISCLNLAGNNIGSIDSDAFDGLPGLRYLNLAGNRVPRYELLQTKLPKLKTLILDGLFSDNSNGFYGYPKHRELRNFMPELKKLSLNNYGENNGILVLNWLESLRIPNLTHLYLSGNGLLSPKLCHIVPDMKNLTHLYMDRTAINYFNTITMPNLRYLSMDGNRIRSLGGDYNNYGNYLIPREMNNLEHLSLANNGMEDIGSAFFESLRNLQFLNLAGNVIRHFPKEVSMNLVNLKNLTLDNNHLPSVPRICELKALRSLSLNGNKIKSVNDTSFCNMQYLSAIYLSNNGLRIIGDETFGHLPALLVLDLSRNYIVSLAEHWIAPNNFIAELHLDGNRFVDIDSMSLKGVNGLECLSIGHNPMKPVTILSLMHLPNSTRIDVFRESTCRPCSAYLPDVYQSID